MNRNILISKILMTASQRYTSQYWKQTKQPIVRSNIANDHFHSFVSWWPNLLSGQRTCFFHISCLPSVVRKSIFNFVFSLRMILYANISGYHRTQCLFQWISWHWMNVGFGHWDGRHTGGQSTHSFVIQIPFSSSRSHDGRHHWMMPLSMLPKDASVLYLFDPNVSNNKNWCFCCRTFKHKRIC